MNTSKIDNDILINTFSNLDKESHNILFSTDINFIQFRLCLEGKMTSSFNNGSYKFHVNENNEISDAAGYHKALFTAMNSDSIANHFYEQCKADAIKNQIAKSKNVDMDPRGTHEAVTTDSGFKIRAISGDDSSKLRIKLRK